MKALLLPSHFINAQSLAASYTGSAVDVSNADTASIQLNYTSSPVGTVAVQASNDGSNWAPLYFSIGGTVTNSLSTSTYTSPIMLTLESLTFRYLRVVYTRTSGSGTLDGYITYKRLGD